MDQNKMMALMTNACMVLNSILRDEDKYTILKEQYKELERQGKMKKLVDLYNLCQTFDEK
jgi:hypothetical protein|tara:strand:- start:573 stop:752 length:180 start_codon:yes stop_codon:yes gene_type:complete